MDYIREAEKYLINYRGLKYSLNSMNKEINKLKWSGSPQEISAMSLDSMPKGNPVQDDMINIIYKLKCFTDMKESTKERLDEIDLILESLDNEFGNYGKVLKLWYVERKPKEEIALELNYSERKSVYNLKDKAIRKFAIRLFGLNALAVV